MKKIILSLLFMLVTAGAWAVKAYPLPVEVVQSDGTTLTVVLHGDEHFHYYTTLDGVLLVEKQGSYYVAITGEGTNLKASAILAHNKEMRSAEELSLASRQDRSSFLLSSEKESSLRRSRQEPIVTKGNMFPHIGSPKAVVILAEFNDSANHFTIEDPKKSFEAYFNSMERLEDYGRGENRNASSVRKYFSDVSFGNFTPDFDVYGPVTLPSPLATYGASTNNGKGERMDLLFRDACQLMDDSLDFSKYDANDDGQVDLVIIIYAGYSESMSGNSTDCIWPKSGTTSGGTYDGKTVSRFAVSAELNGFPGCWSQPPYERINGTGTLCHEFCHTMGMPDLYPTVNSTKGDNQAMEYWSLMDSGNYLVNGYAPVALTAWEREAFGWYTIPTLTEPGYMEVLPLDAKGTAYRILNDNDNSGNEYFIIENIQTIGHNAYQKGHGLLVYHVEYDEYSFSLSSNSVNNVKGHPKMTVIPADGLLFASYNVGKKIDGQTVTNADFYNQLAGDPFPGTANTTALNDTMNIVNFKVYTGDALNKALDKIEEKDGVISFVFTDNFTEYTGISHLEANEAKETDGNIYTIDGRRVLEGALPKGIYIRNGRKVVIR